MAERRENRLMPKEAEAAKTPGMHPDGNGLYLQIAKAGGKSWLLRYRFGGKRKELGLGSFAEVSLKKAREKAEAAREQIRDGKDPLIEKQIAEAKAPDAPELTGDAGLTFGAFGRAMVKAWSPGWKNAKHKAQWTRTVEVECRLLADVPLERVDTDLVLSVLTPLWHKVPETAKRAQGRIKQILDAAAAKGLRDRDRVNPATWEGHLKLLLPKTRTRKQHHDALPYEEVPAFMTKLRNIVVTKASGGAQGVRAVPLVRTEVMPSMSSLALEYTILTASRTSEVTLAKRPEVDFAKKVWTVPPERMKSGREHRVPLPDRAIEILRTVWPFSNDPEGYIFLGGSADGHLSNMAMTMCLRRLDDRGYTVHGFRSTFRDWAGDETDHAREVAEAAIAHIIGEEDEQAYRRGDALARRRALMTDWEAYLGGVTV